MASFDNDIRTVQSALVTLLQSFTDPVAGSGNPTVATTQSACGVASGDVPAIWVRRGRQVNRVEVAADVYQDTYEYYLICYVERLNNTFTPDDSAFDNASDWVKPLHKYLAENREGLSAGTEIAIELVRTTGDQPIPTTNSKMFAGVVFTVPVRMMTLTR